MLVNSHSLEAEQTVLGAVLFSEGASFPGVVSVLKKDDFYRGAHQLIFETMKQLFDAGETIDIITVSETLKDNDALEAAGGRAYINELAISVTTDKVSNSHCKVIKHHALKRQVQFAAMEVIEMADGMSAVAYLEAAQQKFMELSMQTFGREDRSTDDLYEEAIQLIEERKKNPGKCIGYSTGFYKLDSEINGLQNSKFYVLGARPGMGKSAFVLNLALNVAAVAPVLFFNLEMPPAEQAERALRVMSETTANIEAMRKAAANGPKNLMLLDRPDLTLSRIRADILRYKGKLGSVGLVIIDYLQLMEATGRTRVEEVAILSRSMKQMSREFDLPIIALSQLSRKVEERQDKIPMLSDLRESGSLEQDADVVMFIYRDEYYLGEKSKKPGIAEVIIAKQRGGKQGSVDLVFRPFITKFLNYQ